MGPIFDGDRTHRESTVPMPAMISADDLRDARDLLDRHQPTTAGFTCECCAATWPCSEVRYAWMVTGTPPVR